MNINRHNCEALFLDYYEQKLSPVEVAELLCFLEANLDLKDLFEDYAEIQADDAIVPFENKEALKKNHSIEEIDCILQSDINKSNCEYFFVAKAEGILSDDKLKALSLFLISNPEFKKDQELYLQCKLPASKEPFVAKNSLKKVHITAKNREDYYIRAIEKDLSRVEEEQLGAFLTQHPGFRQEYALYVKTILPAETILFENKESLKKKKRKPVLIPLFYQRTVYYAAAASVLLLMGLFFFNRESTTSTDKAIAYRETANTSTSALPQKQEVKNIASENQAVNFSLSKSAEQNKQDEKNGSTENTGTNAANSSSIIYNLSSQTPPTQNVLADKGTENLLHETVLEPMVMEDESNLLALTESSAIPLTQKEAEPALVKNTAADEYQTIGQFARKKIKKTLGIDKASPCQPDDKISAWDVVVAAKNGIQKLTGNKALEVNKTCDGEEGKVEYFFAAGNFRITKSTSK